MPRSTSTAINWFSYEPGTTTMHHVIGDEIGGYADHPNVLTTSPSGTA